MVQELRRECGGEAAACTQGLARSELLCATYAFRALASPAHRACPPGCPLSLPHAAVSHLGQRRSPKAVAWSLQRYLIFAILSCVPDRQRTLRELEVRDRDCTAGGQVGVQGSAQYA